ncbi:hypothetical protein QNI19_14670 [Cytophagaceae bacterium DM2B3-1]|uniref:Uncharacterized protein n=1 Tax=Xanthocytophaga flava TaxID=3048013 RepID=A0ABT7CNB9_9BACT|nr:hypothetical protein [Xanthocytophaga flavus]MDJ1494184.1 hypothetical protein [Xanthocytophaga flavus]
MFNKKVVVPEFEDIQKKVKKYHELFNEKKALEEKLKQLESEIYAGCELNPTWFDESLRVHFGNHGYVYKKLTTKIILPEDMRHANDAKVLKFCKQYPRVVKFELLKSELGKIDYKTWGIQMDHKRVNAIEW